MIVTLSTPSARADVVDHADYLELLALMMDDRSASISDLGRDLAQDGGLGELPEDEVSQEMYPSDRGGERVQELVQLATMEVERRISNCGRNYPFELDERGVLQALRRADSSVYVFMLLLTNCASLNVLPAERKLFEQISTEVAATFLGGGRDVLRVCFGFPRGDGSGFVQALRGLCEKVGEGSVNPVAEGISTQNDGGVDLIAVKRFPDRKMGQLTMFAQCGTGRHWMDKLSDLQPKTFMKLWMAEHLAVDPIKALFVPVAIEENRWRKVAMAAGIPFDRTRIAYHAAELPSSLLEELRDCNVRSLEEMRGG